MKRLCAMLLAAWMLAFCLPFSAFAEESAAGHPEELIVGSPTPVTGSFFHEIFSSNTADADVRELIHGCSLVRREPGQADFSFDPSVVKAVRMVEDQAGNHSYYLVLAEDLFYSDGTPITAWDYAFSFLLLISPELQEAGGRRMDADYLLGYQDYESGRFPCLTGVSVLSDSQMIITLSHRALPYFFETSLLQCTPYPIDAIAPGCRVYDDGYGVYLGNRDPSVPEPVFSASLLRRTLFDPDTGYISHPSVTSGPYVLTSFDGTTCHFLRNGYYKGNTVSDIEKIAFTVLDYRTMTQQLADGELHLVNKAAYGPAIVETMQSVGQTAVRFENYPRIGLTFVAFSTELPTVHEPEVRRAIAWCMDREGLTRAYTQGFGIPVDGFFGIEQWEYLLVNREIDFPIEHLDDEEYDASLAAWEALNLDDLTSYAVDTDRANALLDDAGWTLNRDGGAYRAGTDDVRCKRIGEELVALDLTLMVPEGNAIVSFLEEFFLANLRLCGIRLTPVPVPMQQLLASYYGEAERTADMLYLGTNFHTVIDPVLSYASEEDAALTVWQTLYSDDEELRRLAEEMRRTEPEDVLEYVTRWIAFQKRYNEVLPSIPVYSNIYFDFYTPLLQNYRISEHASWAEAVTEAFWEGSAVSQKEEDYEIIDDYSAGEEDLTEIDDFGDEEDFMEITDFDAEGGFSLNGDVGGDDGDFVEIDDF